MHPEPYGACFCVINGNGVFTAGKQEFELSAGSMFFAPADEAGAMKFVERLFIMEMHDPH